MIDPSEENLFRWKLHQVCKLLPIQQEVNQPRHIADTDLVSGVTNRYWAWVSWFSPAWRGTSWWAATPGPAPAISYPETTPSATPAAVHGPYLATVQGVTIYPYDHAPYSLSRVDSKGQVFMLLQPTYSLRIIADTGYNNHLKYWDLLPLVDNPLINSVRSSEVDHLAEKNPIIHFLIDIWPCILKQVFNASPPFILQVMITFSGSRWVTSLSFLRLLLIQSLKANCSSLRTMCWAPMAPGKFCKSNCAMWKSVNTFETAKECWN